MSSLGFLLLLAASGACGTVGSDVDAAAGGDGAGGGDGPGGAFTLVVAQPRVSVPRAEQVSLRVSVTRRTGFTEAVTLSVQALPTAVTVSPVVVEDGVSEGTLVFEAADAAILGETTTAMLQGSTGNLIESVELAVMVTGHPGTLDETVEGPIPGIKVHDLSPGSEMLHDLRIRDDDAIVAVGEGKDSAGLASFLRAGFLPDGSVHPGIQSGISALPAASATTAYAIELLANQGFLAGGFDVASDLSPNATLAQYNASGSLDPTFSGDGAIIVQWGNTEKLLAVTVATDGKIVAVGFENFLGAVWRFTSDGTLDPSFGGGDGWTMGFLGSTLNDVALLSDGRIVVGGNQAGMLVARLLTDGTLDPTFSSDGSTVVRHLGVRTEARDMVILEDGAILIVGDSDVSGNGDYSLWKLTADGDIDPAFGVGGETRAGTADADEARELLVMPDGRLVVVGNTMSGGTATGITLARFLPDGSHDASFGTAGVSTTTNTGLLTVGSAALASDGRIVIVGGGAGSDGMSIVGRFWN